MIARFVAVQITAIEILQEERDTTDGTGWKTFEYPLDNPVL
jgi:hypothetical protein